MSKRVSNKKGRQRKWAARSYTTVLVHEAGGDFTVIPQRKRIVHRPDGPYRHAAYYVDGTVLSAARAKRFEKFLTPTPPSEVGEDDLIMLV